MHTTNFQTIFSLNWMTLRRFLQICPASFNSLTCFISKKSLKGIIPDSFEGKGACQGISLIYYLSFKPDFLEQQLTNPELTCHQKMPFQENIHKSCFLSFNCHDHRLAKLFQMTLGARYPIETLFV